MLLELHIEDLGLIPSLHLVLDDGLTVLTGETGAGKTMLVEAISLLVGGRADPAVVRAGAAEARVEGRFALDDDHEVVISRVVPAEGRSRAYVDGRLATAATLADLGARLVDLHGQHAHQSLLGVAAQRAALDRYAAVDLTPLRDARGRITEIDAALAALGGDVRTRSRELDLLRFQLAELEAAGIEDPDEDTRLAREEALLAGAQSHREAAAAALAALADTEPAALDGLAAALGVLARTGTAPDGPYADLVDRLRAVEVELRDLADELRRRADAVDDDPARLAAVVERRQLLRTLRRKYGDTLAEVVVYLDETRRRLEELEGYDEAVERLERQREAAVLAERRAAADVAARRRGAAAGLAAAVQVRLRRLAMPRAEVRVVVGEDDPGDEVTFLLAANPGSPPLPLSKVASGGELARAMLALRLELTAGPATLVFDEVDAGIGGAAATAVGDALADLGRRHQVLVVTHLAQVAARADQHVHVTKAVLPTAGAGETTVATASRLDGEARVVEVARMLAGDTASAAAREHAAQLLAGARRAGAS